MGLTIKDLDDKEGFQAVHTARMDIVKRRTSVTKTGKDMRAEANAYNKAVLDEEKRILKLLEPIETHLDTEESRITEEKARIKREAAEAEEARINARERRVENLGMTKRDNTYGVLSFSITQELLITATDEQLDAYCEKVAAGIKADADYKAELQRAEDAEKARLLQVANDQAAAQKKLDDDRAALELEKKKILDKMNADLAEAKRQKDLKEAAEKAAAKAIQDEKDRVAEEARLKETREKKEADVKKRKEARRPDKIKIEDWINAILFSPAPELKTVEGKEVFNRCYILLQDAAGPITKIINEL
jgi:hypothetical protein